MFTMDRRLTEHLTPYELATTHVDRVRPTQNMLTTLREFHRERFSTLFVFVKECLFTTTSDTQLHPEKIAAHYD